MPDEQVRIDVTATDHASQVVGEVAGEVHKLEDAGDVAVVLRAKADTAAAEADIRTLKEQLGLVDGDRATVVVDADTSHAKAALDDVGTHATGARTVTVGALRDMTGPLGAVSTQVGDLGDAFGSVGEIAADKLGLGEAAASALTTGLGIAGAALGGLVALWSAVRGEQQKAKQEVADYRAELAKVNGDTEAAARARIAEKATTAQVKAFNELGLTVDDVAKIITGKTVPAWEQATATGTLVTDTLGKMVISSADQYDLALKLGLASAGQARSMITEAQAWETASDAVNDQTGALRTAAQQYQAQKVFLHDTGDAADGYYRHLQDVNAELDRTSGREATATVKVNVDTAAVDKFFRDLGSHEQVGFKILPSAVAGASALDTRRQGPR
jgi:hypothetical protein